MRSYARRAHCFTCLPAACSGDGNGGFAWKRGHSRRSLEPDEQTRPDQQTVAALPQRYIPTLVYHSTDDQQSPMENLERGLLVFRHGAELSVLDESR